MEDVYDNKDDDVYAHVRVTRLLNPIWNRNKKTLN